MNTKISSLIILLVILSTVIPNATAATPAEIESSIIKGLDYLAGQQGLDGSWGPSEHVAHTSLAVLKFIERAKELGLDPFSTEYEYSQQVINGLNYVLQHAATIPIVPQPAGNPDTDGDGIGVYFQDPVSLIGHRTYSTGTSLMAVSAAASVDGSRIIPVGPLLGWTFDDAVQDTVDYCAFGQNDIAPDRGGWGYFENDANSDNSNSGWLTLGLGYAYDANANIPPFVFTELEVWINYIQYTGADASMYGGSGYTAPDEWVNMLKTGNLLYQMALAGIPKGDQRVTDAVGYQERHWNDADQDPGWKDGAAGSHYQAAFCIMKGFEVYNIDTIDVTVILDWFDDMSTELVNEQNPDGSWPTDIWSSDTIITTAWALLTLERFVPPPPPEPVGGELVPINVVSTYAPSLMILISAIGAITLANRKKPFQAHQQEPTPV